MPADPAAVKALFLEAVAIDDLVVRAALLNERCREDAALFARVNALLVANDRAVANEGTGSIRIEGGSGAVEPTADFSSKAEHIGAILVGKYKLIEEIGEGGMGSVYMAQQTDPVKRAVAVKVIKTGMDSKAVLARFDAERQALAMMDHPNIAKVLDAGTTDSGRPFFVMELVKGVSITQYCDERNLTPRQRLELFVPVCQAIQHAHQKGIIHRDIKPSNVLVAIYDDRPVPKVIDFGVAKAAGPGLTDRTLMTGFGAVVGTPEYMSPEQASLNNVDIDTRSDVYSLGVLLYELLTGTTPLEQKRLKEVALLELLRRIREEEPPNPSTRLNTTQELPSIAAHRGLEPRKLSDLIRGELDWIIMKALEKDRVRRYETANAFAADVQRYLADEPVQACPPSTGYRLHKFVRRNKWPVLATTLVFLALVGGIIGTTWGLVLADNARQRAVQAQQAESEQKRLADQRAEAANKSEARTREEKRYAEQQRDRANQLAYTKQLVLAQREWRDDNVGHALELLDECPMNVRGWEHRHLYARFTSNQRTLRGHTSGVSSVNWSPDGKLLASASQDGTVKLWDAQNRRDMLTFKGHSHWVTSVCFSPDGRRLASASRNPGHPGEVKVWDAHMGQEILTLKGHTNAVLCVCWSPDGKRLASASWDQMVKVWDTGTGQETLSLKAHADGVNSLSWSPDGHHLASGGSDRTVKVWDAEKGQEVCCLRGHTGWVNSVSWSPDGKRLASASWDQTVKVWDAETEQEMLSIKAHANGVNDVSWSPDGKRLASAGNDRTVKVWDAMTGREAVRLKGHAYHVQSVAFSPEGKRLASAGGDHSTTLGKPGEVKLWDPNKGQEPLTFQGQGEIECLCWNPGDNRLASASTDGTVKVWDAKNGQEIITFKGHSDEVQSVSWSPDGKRLASAGWDQTVKVWNPQTGQELLTLMAHSGKLQSVAWSPDGKRLVSALGDRWDWIRPGEVKMWDAENGRAILTLKGHVRRVWSVSWSPDGRRLASASGDQTVKVWDADTGQSLLILKGHCAEVHNVCFSPDGTRLASASWDQTVKVWDALTGREAHSLKGHTDGVWCVAFSPDGQRLASASRDGTIKLWDPESGQETLTLDVHSKPVSSLCWSPDGNCLAGGGLGAVQIWDAGTSGNAAPPAAR